MKGSYYTLCSVKNTSAVCVNHINTQPNLVPSALPSMLHIAPWNYEAVTENRLSLNKQLLNKKNVTLYNLDSTFQQNVNSNKTQNFQFYEREAMFSVFLLSLLLTMPQKCLQKFCPGFFDKQPLCHVLELINLSWIIKYG